MKVSLFLLSSILCGSALASLNATQIVRDLPSCGLKCSIELLTAAHCSLLDSAPCLCTNVTLQAQVSKCVQQNCTFYDQIKAANTQTQICEGYPQESRSHYVRTMSITFLAITFAFLIMRLTSRYIISQQMWPDDWAAVLATVFVMIGGALQIAAAEKGFGDHYWNVAPSEAPGLLKLFYALQVLYALIQDTAKISLLLLYIRIFPGPKFRLICNLTIAFIVAHGFAFTMAILFQCTPINLVWNKSMEGKCIDLTAVGYAGAAMSIFEDLVILVLPFPQLNTLKASLGKRIGLMAMFAVGSFACVTSMIRLKFIHTFSNSTFDSSWDNVPILLWSQVEVDMALICACLPALRPFIMSLIPKVYEKYWSSREKTTQRSAGNTNNSHRMQRWKKSFGSSSTESYVGLAEEGADMPKAVLKRESTSLSLGVERGQRLV